MSIFSPMKVFAKDRPDQIADFYSFFLVLSIKIISAEKLVFLVDSIILNMGLFSSSNETKCKKCGTVLSDHERLKRHQEIAHGKKKEKCRACDTEFDSLEDLRKHKKNCK
jgi:hypothetical protein